MPEIDPTRPLDTDIVSQYPTNERASRQAIQDIIGAEHNSTTGRHKIPTGSTSSRDAITTWHRGSLWLNTDFTPARLQAQTAETAPFSWVSAAGEFTTGTKMLFAQATAPTGWTQDTSLNDRVVRVVSGAGAGTGGSWTITGLTHPHQHETGAVSSGGMTLGVVPIEHWPHGTRPSRTSARTSTGAVLEDRPTLLTGPAIEPDDAILSDGVWRPSYVDMIVATKS